MLLRSASTPILNSWSPNSSSISPFSDQIKSITLTTTSSNCIPNSTTRNMLRTSSDSDFRSGSGFGSGSRLSANSSILGLRETVVLVEEEEEEFTSSDGGCCGGGGGGRRLFNDDHNNDDDNNVNNNVNCEVNVKNAVSGVDVYYVKMIEANPGNSLLLGNYAKFLKEVQGDYVKAEEYCGRAILANPGDPSMLALYADLIWQTQRDSLRA